MLNYTFFIKAALSTGLDTLNKQINQLRQEYMAKQESQFFEAMKLDLELEEKLKALTGRDKVTARVTKEYHVHIRGEIYERHNPF